MSEWPASDGPQRIDQRPLQRPQVACLVNGLAHQSGGEHDEQDAGVLEERLQVDLTAEPVDEDTHHGSDGETDGAAHHDVGAS